MKKITGIALVIMLIGLLTQCTYEKEKAQIDGQPDLEKTFKVVGYYLGETFDKPLENLQADKLTHLVYAFLIPNKDGSLKPLKNPDEFEQLVQKCREAGTKVYIGVGGWSYEGVTLVKTFERIAKSEDLREKLVKNITGFVLEYGLDGVELDWEHPDVASGWDYEKLVIELGASLSKEGKNLTAALKGSGTTERNVEDEKIISDKCLDTFEFVSVMAYDLNDRDHSPFWFSASSIDYWFNRGVPKMKIILGMPLYARPSLLEYYQLVELDKANAYNDFAQTQPVESYYNGLNTLKDKTVLAWNKAGGVMVFDVNEDTMDETSVLIMIEATIDSLL
ncbi:MAG: hypothetical protein JJE49_07030 [Peptostreptococcaceae bacterium]|nr:hypothetical protein [Peptostreptococcaceae bacterium]